MSAAGTSGQSPISGGQQQGGGSSGASNGGSSAGSASGGSSGSGAGSSGAGANAGGAASGGAGGANSAGSGGATFAKDPMVYVGGYDANFRSYRLNRSTRALTEAGAPVNLGSNPTYIAVNTARTRLYVANESDGAQGGITAASIGADGTLSPLGRQGFENLGFVHVSVSMNGRFVIAASYNGGAVAVFPVSGTAGPGAAVDNEHFGNSAQSHSSAFDASGSYVFIPNKGLNSIAQFAFDENSGTLTASSPAQVAAKSGAGPRHMALHPNGSIAYVANELDSTVATYAVSASGQLTAKGSLSTLPANFSGKSTGAHVEITPNGKLLFASNRGHDSIAVFSIDATSGALTLLEHEPTRGKTPRDFDVDPSGSYLIAANQDSSSLAVFDIEATGLTPVGDLVTSARSPAAVQFVYLP
jgi:6-phosphogluconolactonase